MGEDTTPEGSGPYATVEELPALRVIEAFGGIRPMAAKLEVAVSTVQGWKARGTIPASRHEDVRAAARAHGVAFDEADLADGAPEAAEDAATPEPAPGATDAAPAEAAPRRADTPKPAAAPAPPAAAVRPARADTPKPTAAPAPPAAAVRPARAERRSGWLTGFLAGALVLAAGAGGAVLTRDLWAPPPAGGNGADPARLGELDSRLTALEGRPSGAEPPSLEGLASADEVERLSEALADIDSEIAGLDAWIVAAPEGIASLEARLEALEARPAAEPADLSGLEARIEALDSGAAAGAEAAMALAALQDELSDLRGKLAATEARLADADTGLQSLIAGEQAARSAAARQAGAMLALTQLRDRLRGSAPYAAELTALRVFTADDPETAALLDPLAGHAASGIPSLEGLRRGFPEVARRVVTAGRGEGENDMLGEILRRISEVVSIRPVGDVPGDDPGAIVARAEVRLDEGNLAGALVQLEALTGAAAVETEAWRADAQARLDAEDAIAVLTGQVGAALAAGG